MSQERQGKCTNQATSQLYGVMPDQQNITRHVHHLSADEAQENPEVVTGMFSVNTIPAVILFDSGASHSFISRSFVAQNKFPCSLLGKNMLVQTPGSLARAIWSVVI